MTFSHVIPEPIHERRGVAISLVVAVAWWISIAHLHSPARQTVAEVPNGASVCRVGHGIDGVDNTFWMMNFIALRPASLFEPQGRYIARAAESTGSWRVVR